MIAKRKAIIDVDSNGNTKTISVDTKGTNAFPTVIYNQFRVEFNFMENIQNKLILLTICFVPLIMNPFTYYAYTDIKAYFLYIITVLLLIFYFIKLRKKKTINSLQDYFLSIYLILVFISAFLSNYNLYAIIGASNRREGLATICCYIFLYFITERYYTFSRKHIKYFSASALIVSAYGVLQYFGLDPLIGFGSRIQALSTIGNRNFVGSYISLVLPIILFIFAYTKKNLYLILSSVLFLCMLCSYTRSAWVTFIIFIPLMSLYICIFNINFKRYIIVIPIFVILLVGFNFISQNQTLSRFYTLTSDSAGIVQGDFSDNAGSQRMFIWKRAITLLPERPWLGSGPDTFEYIFMNKYGLDVQKYVEGGVRTSKTKEGELVLHVKKVDKAHNEYLQIALTTGIPSLIVYLIFIGISLYKAKKTIKKNIFIIPLFCAVIGYLIQAFFNISVVAVAPIFWIVLGIMNNFSKKY